MTAEHVGMYILQPEEDRMRHLSFIDRLLEAHGWVGLLHLSLLNLHRHVKAEPNSV